MLTAFAMLIGLLAPNSGQLLIDAQPTSVTVEIDGKRTPYKPGKAITVPAGSRKVTVTQSGYKSETRSIAVKPGGTTRAQFRLQSLNKAPAATKRPTLRKPTTVAKRPTTTKQPAAKQPAAKQPAAKQPAAKRPTAKRPTAKRPVAKRPTTKEPQASPRPTKKPVVATKTPQTAPRQPTTKPRETRPTTTRPAVGERPRTTRPVHGGGGAYGAAPPQPEPRSRPSYKPWAVFSFVVGGLALTGGVLAGMQADDRAESFNKSVVRNDKQQFKNEAEGWALGSNVAYGVGATAVAVGFLLWAMDPADGYAATVAPLPEGGAVVGLGGTF